jgi:hypothetical protein
MFTDGGGWLLVGRKNSLVTWTVPSSSNPVEPFGDPHWSSSLGDAQIVDFRVQVATKKDFSTTRADWYVCKTTFRNDPKLYFKHNNFNRNIIVLK